MSLSAALTLGCDRPGKKQAVTTAPPGPEESLRRVIFALGPWPAGEKEMARDFARRFLAAGGPASAYLTESGQLLQGIARHFPEDTLALSKVDLGALSGSERELLENLVAQIYNYVEVRFVVSGAPPWGECQPDRMGYTRKPKT